MSSSERPAFSTMAFCARRQAFKSNSSSMSPLTSDGRATLPWPWKPRMTARSAAPRSSMTSGSTAFFEVAIWLSTPSFATTRSRSSVSLSKAAAASSSCASWEEVSGAGAAAMVTVMSLTDLKIVEAIFLTWRSSFSSGLRTWAETKLESISDQPTISPMITAKRRMFMSASIWKGLLKLNSHTRLVPSYSKELAARCGGPRGGSQGRTASTASGSAAPDLAVSLYG
mmetsp:Transcript_74881/g.198935  ORF Transcript_74881/g.198935 Transcript_74881/m.198935 type:complete len:227 (+) Transcript_74881:167-847(+)